MTERDRLRRWFSRVLDRLGAECLAWQSERLPNGGRLEQRCDLLLDTCEPSDVVALFLVRVPTAAARTCLSSDETDSGRKGSGTETSGAGALPASDGNEHRGVSDTGRTHDEKERLFPLVEAVLDQAFRT